MGKAARQLATHRAPVSTHPIPVVKATRYFSESGQLNMSLAYAKRASVKINFPAINSCSDLALKFAYPLDEVRYVLVGAMPSVPVIGGINIVAELLEAQGQVRHHCQ